MRKFLVSPIAACCMLLAAGGANALSFTIADAGGDSMTTNVASSSGSHTYRGGAFSVGPTGGGWPSYIPDSFISYCVQIPQNLSWGTLPGY